jgi:hypothetical protein
MYEIWTYGVTAAHGKGRLRGPETLAAEGLQGDDLWMAAAEGVSHGALVEAKGRSK